jgi:hypothetical protein
MHLQNEEGSDIVVAPASAASGSSICRWCPPIGQSRDFSPFTASQPSDLLTFVALLVIPHPTPPSASAGPRSPAASSPSSTVASAPPSSPARKFAARTAQQPHVPATLHLRQIKPPHRQRERDGGSSAAGDGEVGARSGRCGPCLTSLELYFRPPTEEGERPGRSAAADPSSTLLSPPWPPPLPCPATVGSSTTCFSSTAPPHKL